MFGWWFSVIKIRWKKHASTMATRRTSVILKLGAIPPWSRLENEFTDGDFQNIIHNVCFYAVKLPGCVFAWISMVKCLCTDGLLLWRCETLFWWSLTVETQVWASAAVCQHIWRALRWETAVACDGKLVTLLLLYFQNCCFQAMCDELSWM